MWVKSSTVSPLDLVSVEECRKHLDYPSTDTSNDADIERMIRAAYEEAERHSNRVFLQATVTEYFDTFPDCIYLKAAPAASITSVQYYDSDNTLQTWAATNYDAGQDLVSTPGRLMPDDGVSWPTVYSRPNAIVVTYVAGSTAAHLVPARARQAILLTVGNWNENRAAVQEGTAKEMPLSAQNLLDGLWTGV